MPTLDLALGLRVMGCATDVAHAVGLSMVYGFVKQSAGHITVESEMGQGTREKIICSFVKVRRE
jgi:signal transduction histidine kinase